LPFGNPIAKVPAARPRGIDLNRCRPEDTRTVFWFGAPLNILCIPCASILAFLLGLAASGVWWAINVTTCLRAALKGWAAWRAVRRRSTRDP
ncbi:MAG: hypothetical protein ACREXR_21250, partial [Gammaproteobacteria bacterium]